MKNKKSKNNNEEGLVKSANGYGLCSQGANATQAVNDKIKVNKCNEKHDSKQFGNV